MWSSRTSFQVCNKWDDAASLGRRFGVAGGFGGGADRVAEPPVGNAEVDEHDADGGDGCDQGGAGGRGVTLELREQEREGHPDEAAEDDSQDHREPDGHNHFRSAETGDDHDGGGHREPERD